MLVSWHVPVFLFFLYLSYFQLGQQQQTFMVENYFCMWFFPQCKYHRYGIFKSWSKKFVWLAEFQLELLMQSLFFSRVCLWSYWLFNLCNFSWSIDCTIIPRISIYFVTWCFWNLDNVLRFISSFRLVFLMEKMSITWLGLW